MRMAARIIAGVLALLGILVAGGGALLLLNDVQSSTQLVEEAEPLVGELPNQDEFDEIIAMQTNSAYALFGAAVLALIGAVLSFMGRGLIAGPLLLVAGILPYIVRLEAFIFVFSGLFLLAGFIAFFARRKPPEPATAPPAAVA